MSHHNEKSSRRFRWLAAWAVVLGFVAWQDVTPAHASHSHNTWNQLHLAYMHYASAGSTAGVYDEQYCIQSYSSSINAASISQFIRDTLTALDWSVIWDGTGDWKIDLWRMPLYCTQYATAARNEIEIEYRIKDSWAAECGGDQWSCVVHVNPQVDSVDGHTHYRWMNSLLKTSHVWDFNNRTRKFINHETGHIFGLGDPRWWNDCPYSVMHNDLYGPIYNCWDPVWHPTPNDFASVKSVMARTNW